MLPVTAVREKYSNDVQLRLTARNRAYENLYHDIYRHMMRYETDEVAERLDLSESDIKIFKHFTNMQEEMELPVKFITINLPDDHIPDESIAQLKRCLKKCYVGEWHYAFELGPKGTHPHYHVYFVSTVKWLAKSRIIQEWAHIFGIGKNFVNVLSTSKAQMSNLEGYISKEKIHKHSSIAENMKNKKSCTLSTTNAIQKKVISKTNSQKTRSKDAV